MFGIRRPRIRLEDSQELLHHAGEFGEEVVERGKNLWHGFTDWALQDNILEVAVGLMFVVQLRPRSKSEFMDDAKTNPVTQNRCSFHNRSDKLRE
jgi:hypothetical protein